jgi:hypothetical protein
VVATAQYLTDLRHSAGLPKRFREAQIGEIEMQRFQRQIATLTNGREQIDSPLYDSAFEKTLSDLVVPAFSAAGIADRLEKSIVAEPGDFLGTADKAAVQRALQAVRGALQKLELTGFAGSAHQPPNVMEALQHMRRNANLLFSNPQ